MREEKGVRGWIFYERYAALGGDPTYIRGKLYDSSVVPSELPPHPNWRETIANSDDEDPDGFREFPPAGGAGPGDGRDGEDGGDGGGEIHIPEQPIRDPPVQKPSIPEVQWTPIRPTTVEIQRPVGPEISLGTIPDVEEEVDSTFTERSQAFANFV